MLNIITLKNVLLISLSASIITTSLIQKIKSLLPKKHYIIFTTVVLSLIIGTLFSLTFSDLNIIDSLWVGLITFIGADSIYKMFEDKIFSRYEDLTKEENTNTSTEKIPDSKEEYIVIERTN